MSRRAGRIAVLVWAAVLGVGVGSRAAAEGAAPAAPSSVSSAPGDDDKEARRLFQRAELAFNLGKFEEALADYQSAYQAKPLSAFLFNIAQCYRNLGNWERARFFYRRYLTLVPRSPNRHRVEDLVAEMTQKLEQPPPVVPPTPAADVTAPPPTPAPPLPAPPSVPILDPGPPTADATLLAAPAPAHKPVYKRWWFWTGVGVLVAGGVVAAVVLAKPSTKTPGTLDPIDGRQP